DKKVAELAKDAAEDKAAAITFGLEADAAEIRLKNKAEAAGWRTAVEALDGDGKAYARYVLFQKLAPGFRSIMTNTADSPLMEMFRNFSHEARQTDDSSNEKAGD
ncbi:MAG: band 7 protein, partial [Pirellulaceae bacterium]